MRCLASQSGEQHTLDIKITENATDRGTKGPKGIALQVEAGDLNLLPTTPAAAAGAWLQWEGVGGWACIRNVIESARTEEGRRIETTGGLSYRFMDPLPTLATLTTPAARHHSSGFQQVCPTTVATLTDRSVQLRANPQLARSLSKEEQDSRITLDTAQLFFDGLFDAAPIRLAKLSHLPYGPLQVPLGKQIVLAIGQLKAADATCRNASNLTGVSRYWIALTIFKFTRLKHNLLTGRRVLLQAQAFATHGFLSGPNRVLHYVSSRVHAKRAKPLHATCHPRS